MIYSILQSVNKGVEKPVRYSLNFLLGTVIYIILHWILFSSIGDKYANVKKFRMALYAVFGIDFYMFLKIRNTQAKQLPQCNNEKTNNDQAATTQVVTKEESKPENEMAQPQKDISSKDACSKDAHSNSKKECEVRSVTRDKKSNNVGKEVEKKEIKELCEKKLSDTHSDATIPIYKHKPMDTMSIELPVYVSSKQIVKDTVNEKVEKNIQSQPEPEINMNNVINEINNETNKDDELDGLDADEVNKIMNDTTSTEKK